MDIRLDGKVAIVTGGSRGIGRGIAAAMAEAGAKVMITSRNEETCAATVDDLRASTGGDLAWVAGHVGKFEDMQRVLDGTCLLYTSPSPRDGLLSRMPSSA